MTRVRILFLAHRAPSAPDKGERIRAFHFLTALAQRHDVYLGAHVEEDAAGARRALSPLCADLCLRPLPTTVRTVRIARAVLAGRAASLEAFRDAALQRWVADRLRQGIDLVFLYSLAAIEALPSVAVGVPLLADLVDCDAAKWAELADRTRDPLHRLLYAREARLVAATERRLLAACRLALVAAAREVEALAAVHARPCPGVRVLTNGVDSDFFDPSLSFPDPYPPPRRPTLVFTGAMDYPPNAEAALWFARAVLPRLEARGLPCRFAVVGRHPGRRLRRLADGQRVIVTGWVEDVRPWLAHADIAVVPLAVARGVQNKLLEAMAMAKPVVASPAAARGIAALPGRELAVAADAAAMAEEIGRLLASRERASALGAAARAHVRAHYRWQDRCLELLAACEEVAASTPSSRASFSTTRALASQLRSSS
ncbi:hypothetical protein HRbin40_02179 [bacterium HR40]|nr:hypothetical protein HRbin40_02179 [bacterium HR40]